MGLIPSPPRSRSHRIGIDACNRPPSSGPTTPDTGAGNVSRLVCTRVDCLSHPPLGRDRRLRAGRTLPDSHGSRSVARRSIRSRSSTAGLLRVAWAPQISTRRASFPGSAGPRAQPPSALFALLDDFRLFDLLFHLLFRQRLRGGLDFFVLDLG